MLIIVICLGAINAAMLGYLLFKSKPDGLDGALREEFRQNRREFAEANKELRVKLTGSLTHTRETMDKRLEQVRDKNDEKLEQIRKTVEGRLESLRKTMLKNSRKCG